MKIAILHYHLRPGGVTRVIECASRSLTAAGIRHVIIVGSTPPNRSQDLPVRVVEGLDYPTPEHAPSAEILEAQIREAADQALGCQPSVWHFHNSSLGKNVCFHEVAMRLAAAGENLVLQIHDLAEDGRPSNYQRFSNQSRIHPIAPNIRYALINGRDYDRFLMAGLPPPNAHLLPNPVLPATRLPQSASNHSPLIFYPVRGIRRKNLGEILMLAAMASPGVNFAIAAAPDNPQWRDIHDGWCSFAASHDLPVEFDVVDRLSPTPETESTFAAWIAASTHLVTTSIAEGFGYSFLDSVNYQKPLIGRAIPYLAKDHLDHRIHFPGLYEQIIIPHHWINEAELSYLLESHLQATYRQYGVPLPVNAIDSAWQAIQLPHGYDFGNLPEMIQRSCISRCLAESHAPLIQTIGAVTPAKSWLDDLLSARGSVTPRASLAPFSEASYIDHLRQLYSCWPERADPCGWLDSSRLLSLYLAPGNFHFLTDSSQMFPDPKLPIPNTVSR